MTKIKVQHFGPIKEGFLEYDGWMDILKLTVFIGDQGAGKSSLAKIVSVFMWMEKVLVRGDFQLKDLEKNNYFVNHILPYHRLEHYIQAATFLAYQGARYQFEFSLGRLSIKELNEGEHYALPQIMYVPAERNFLAYVRYPRELKLSSASLQEFLSVYEQAKGSLLKQNLALPINRVALQYDRLNDSLNIIGSDYKLRLDHASSGFQSLVPLYLVSAYLAKQVQDKEEGDGMTVEQSERFKSELKSIFDNSQLTKEQQRLMISVLSENYIKTAFINVVEEPEQNLFPDSQWKVLEQLLCLNNMTTDNKLLLTTHSPYMISFLNIAIQAKELEEKLVNRKDSAHLMAKMRKILSLEAATSIRDVVVYQLDAQQGTIIKLADDYGIPSTNNYLNNILGESNRLFDQLLEIEEEL